MRLDPKYFNLFLVICAALTLLVIVYGTIRYVSNQQIVFKQNLDEVEISTIQFAQYAADDSLSTDQFSGFPIVLHFWSTWSDMSMNVNRELAELSNRYPELVVIAAAARDGDEQVLQYISENSYPFEYVNGTDFYLDMLIPGLPSQIFINREGEIVDTQVGEDLGQIRQKVERLVEGE